jgi:hypothetical protein
MSPSGRGEAAACGGRLPRKQQQRTYAQEAHGVSGRGRGRDRGVGGGTAWAESDAHARTPPSRVWARALARVRPLQRALAQPQLPRGAQRIEFKVERVERGLAVGVEAALAEEAALRRHPARQPWVLAPAARHARVTMHLVE